MHSSQSLPSALLLKWSRTLNMPYFTPWSFLDMYYRMQFRYYDLWQYKSSWFLYVSPRTLLTVSAHNIRLCSSISYLKKRWLACLFYHNAKALATEFSSRDVCILAEKGTAQGTLLTWPQETANEPLGQAAVQRFINTQSVVTSHGNKTVNTA